LVEKNDCRRGRQCVWKESVDRELALIIPQLEEVLLDAVVEVGVGGPPLLGLQP
jgi:hypothetical protein